MRINDGDDTWARRRVRRVSIIGKVRRREGTQGVRNSADSHRAYYSERKQRKKLIHLFLKGFFITFCDFM